MDVLVDLAVTVEVNWIDEGILKSSLWWWWWRKCRVPESLPGIDSR